MLRCYNRGCGQDYDPQNNNDGEYKDVWRTKILTNK